MKEFYSGKKILITGAGGYIGSLLVNSLSEVSCEITRLSSRELPGIAVTKSTIKDVITDWSDFALLLTLVKEADVIFHLRAQTSAYKAEANPKDDFALNVEPLSQLLSAAHKAQNKPSVVVASTVTVYGLTPKNEKIDETYPPSPTTVYDIHKLACESLIENFSKRGTVNGASIRLANVYGPGVKSSSSDRGILNLIVKKALQGEVITIFGDGDYLRDYIYVDDVVNAFLHVGAFAPKKGEAYNVSSSQSRTLVSAIKEVASIVKESTGIDMKYSFVPEPEYLLPIEKRDFTGDNSRIIKNTGWRPQMSFHDGVVKTVRSFQ